MDEFQLNGTYVDNSQLSNNEMCSIYTALSVPDNTDIDTNDEMQYIQNCIESLYDLDFKLIDKSVIENSAFLLNNKFVELVKYCKSKDNYKKIGYLFIGFCNYFDIDEIVAYKNLHEKLQLLIKKSTINICGKQNYKYHEKKNYEKSEHAGIHVVSLFSLVNK